MKVITICGSLKFQNEMMSISEKLSLEGNCVFTPVYPVIKRKRTKEELDKCSTCDMCATINDGLSDASREQLKGKSGEEIVDADIAKQMGE